MLKWESEKGLKEAKFIKFSPPLHCHNLKIHKNLHNPYIHAIFKIKTITFDTFDIKQSPDY